MTLFIRDSAMDLMLADGDSGTELYLCSGDPTTRAEAITNSLTDTGTPETPPTGTPGDGTPNGREVAYAAKAGLAITANGPAAVVCLTTGADLVLKTDLAAPIVVAISDTVDLAAFTHDVGDPA